MNSTSTQSRQDTETHCHCGAAYRGSDHCPNCYCEQYEGGCDDVYEPECEGHPAEDCGMPFAAIGETVFCDGSCVPA
jgi:hypothetical protein